MKILAYLFAGLADDVVFAKIVVVGAMLAVMLVLAIVHAWINRKKKS